MAVAIPVASVSFDSNSESDIFRRTIGESDKLSKVPVEMLLPLGNDGDKPIRIDLFRSRGDLKGCFDFGPLGVGAKGFDRGPGASAFFNDGPDFSATD